MPLGGKLVLKGEREAGPASAGGLGARRAHAHTQRARVLPTACAGGETLAGSVQKKTKKKGKKDAPAAEEQQGEEGGEQQPGSNKPKPIAPTAVNVLSGKNYEAVRRSRRDQRDAGGSVPRSGAHAS